MKKKIAKNFNKYFFVSHSDGKHSKFALTVSDKCEVSSDVEFLI